MTSTFKGTPGPWVRDKYGHIVDTTGKDVRFRSVTVLAAGASERIAESEANTDLIAAAHDLLEALQAAVDCGMVPVSSASEGGAVRYSIQVRVADQIRAAIAKALGDDK